MNGLRTTNLSERRYNNGKAIEKRGSLVLEGRIVFGSDH